MLSVLSDIMSVENVDAVLQKIGATLAELFSVRRLVVGVWEENEQLYRVRATFGYPADRDRKIKKFTYTVERMNMDLDEKWKIADSVYLVRPDPEDFIKGEEPFYNDMARIKLPRTDPSVWHELDYVRFVISSRMGRNVGFIEVNEVKDDKIPDMETLESMHLFSQLAGVAIENATTYQSQVEQAKRSKFLGDIIAHDINNYNQAVTSYLQMAIESKTVPDVTALYLERASSAAWSISELILRANKLLRIEEEGTENIGPVELGEILKESAAEVTRNHTEKEIKLDLRLGSHRYFVTGNELAKEIFTNILENAVEYDPHEKVLVEVTIGEFTIEPRKYWCVSVADRGIGIPDSKKNVVFGRSLFGEESPPASGIGLSIVRAIVEGYHGLVWVEDREMGDPSKGSVFRVALPMASIK
jgi:signal transduction histidine kinase